MLGTPHTCLVPSPSYLPWVARGRRGARSGRPCRSGARAPPRRAGRTFHPPSPAAEKGRKIDISARISANRSLLHTSLVIERKRHTCGRKSEQKYSLTCASTRPVWRVDFNSLKCSLEHLKWWGSGRKSKIVERSSTSGCCQCASPLRPLPLCRLVAMGWLLGAGC